MFITFAQYGYAVLGKLYFVILLLFTSGQCSYILKKVTLYSSVNVLNIRMSIKKV